MTSAKCVICTDEFPGIDDLEAHISADHYNCLPFECEKCKFAKFPTEFAIKRHYEEDHGLVEYFIRYRVSREIYEKKQKVRECLERCIRHSDVSSGQHQIALANSRNIIGGDYPPTATASSSTSHSSHYQSRQQQLHESEFLTSAKVRGQHAAVELFQQQHGGPLLSSSAAADIRHQHHHQSDFGSIVGGNAVDADSVSGYDSIGGPNLIGNLLEEIKPEVDTGPLSHFDQIYAAEVTSAADPQRGIEKFITTQAKSELDQIPQFLQQQKPATTVSISVVKRGTSPSSKNKQQENGTSTSAATSTSSSISAKMPATSIGFSIPSAPPPACPLVTSTRRPMELQCSVCKQMVVNRSTSLMYHVNVKHLKLAMFKCLNCGEEFLWNKSAAIRHAHRHGGDETLIENYSERLFPTLNRHRREYFNLIKRGIEDSPTPPLSQEQEMQDGAGTEEKEEEVNEGTIARGGAGTGRPRRLRRSRELSIDNVGMKQEEEDVESMDGEGPQQIVVDEEREKAKRSRRSTRNIGGVGGTGDGRMDEDGDSDKKVQTPNTILAQLVDMTRGGNGTTSTTTPSGSNSQQQNGHQATPSSSSTTFSAEHLKAHKSVQCGGCGDMVINQEWIMLNHVNTKHLHLPLYKCVSCNKPFENYLRSYAVRHAKFYHAGDESLLLDQREMFLGEMREAGAQLFSLNGGGKGGGDSA